MLKTRLCGKKTKINRTDLLSRDLASRFRRYARAERQHGDHAPLAIEGPKGAIHIPDAVKGGGRIGSVDWATDAEGVRAVATEDSR